MIANVLLFIFLLPAIIISLFSTNFLVAFFISVGIIIIFISGSLFISFKSYYQGIEMDDLEGRLTRYGPLSAGDKEFFELMSKPFAFMVQFAMLFIHFIILKDLYWD